MITTRCPICNREIRVANLAEWPELPFCSKRCRQIDLGRWLAEDYRVPVQHPPDQESPADSDPSPC